MTTVLVGTSLSDDERRKKIFAGHIVLHPPTAASLEFCAFARSMLAEAFGSLDPEYAQYELPVSEFAALLSVLKPKFIHDPRSKQYIRRILAEMGCDAATTYFDTPRMRSSTSDEYLTSGIAYAFHPHRDTWYSAPMCQINYWMPIYEIESTNAMAFHPAYWSNALPNGSSDYDYQQWVATNRFTAAQHVGKDTRQQPRSFNPVEMDPDIRLIPPVGGMIVFSAAQLHSSAPNTSGRTRYSIDFRSVNIRDLECEAGASNVDSCCTGTATPDYLRMTDLCNLPQSIIDKYLPGHPQRPAWHPSASPAEEGRAATSAA